MVPRIKIGKGVTGAAQYVLGEGRGAGNDNLAPDEQTRVAWIGGQSFGFEIGSREDADLGRRIMEFDALNQTSRTKRCEKDAVHLMLAWRTGDAPSRETMEDAARGALAALGMENAKAIWAAHRDEPQAHLHIVASKIDPDTGRAYNLKADFLKLSRWAEQYERDHGGVVCLRREEANTLRDGIGERDPAAVLEAMTRQRSTFTAADLERALAKQIPEQLTRAQFGNGILDRADVVRLTDHAGGPTTRYTTRTVLEAEQYVLRAVSGLARDERHAIAPRTLTAVTERMDREGGGLGPDQRGALDHATKPGGFALIDGQAGSGKSHAMGAIRQAYEAQGYQVIGTSWTNAVVQDMKADGFRLANTVKSELMRLANGRQQWNARTVIMVDEAAMIDTKHLALLSTYAREAGAKLILIGDDRQLASIDRGGMFGALKDRHGAAALTELRRYHKDEDRRAASMMAEGNFADALAIYQEKGGIHWTRTQDQARAALVETWAKDTASSPEKSRFVFAYTNADVAELNADIRAVRRERGELGPDQELPAADGKHVFATGDRMQFTGTDKARGIYNGAAGTIRVIAGTTMTVALDSRRDQTVTFDTAQFDKFRHGYAGTIYRGQGRTLDQTYLYHSEHWRSAASYVALTRHRDKAEVFVATNTARDAAHLARQMARVDDRRAASQFHAGKEPEPVRPLTARELVEHLGVTSFRRRADDGAELRPVQTGTAAAASGEANAANKAAAQQRRMKMEPVTDEAITKRGAEIVAKLDEVKAADPANDPALLFKDWKERQAREAEEANKRIAERQSAEAARIRAGEIADPQERYAAALVGFNAKDPYASLIAAAVAEAAIAREQQAEWRRKEAEEMAKEKPDQHKLDVYRLSRQIEGHEYMVYTGQKLAGMSRVSGGAGAERRAEQRGDVDENGRGVTQATLYAAEHKAHQERATALREELASKQRDHDAKALDSYAKDVKEGEAGARKVLGRGEITDVKREKSASRINKNMDNINDDTASRVAQRAQGRGGGASR